MDRSKAQIEQVLRQYGADRFGYATTATHAEIAFSLDGQAYRIALSFPPPEDERYRETPTGRRRYTNVARQAWEKETRRRWRSLFMVIKAKLVAVEDGISTMREEFLAHLLLPDGQTVGEWLSPQVEELLDKGKMPKLLGM